MPRLHFPPRSRGYQALFSLVTLLSVLVGWWFVQAADPAPEIPPPARWGPLQVGDRVGMVDIGPAYQLNLAPAGQKSGYRLQRIVRSEGTTLLVLAPPEEVTLALGLVREIWIPTTAIRSVQVR